jgi:cytochrome c oxidase subunit II
MLEHQLASLPSGQADEQEATKRKQRSPWKHRSLGIVKAQAPICADCSEQHHCNHGVGPAFGTTADTAAGKQFCRSSNSGEHAHAEAPAAGPEPHARKKRISGQPPEQVRPQRSDDQSDWESDQHRVDRMSSERNLGSDIKVMSFVKFRHALPTRVAHAGCAAGLLMLPSCAGELSTLEPAGPAAARVAELWWVMFAGAMLILIGVVAVVIYSFRRNRPVPEFSERRVLVGWGLVFPFVTLFALMMFAFLRGEELLARPDPDILVIEGQSNQWSWTFVYPGGVHTTGILHVPAGETFHVNVSSADVIHSFWVPRLGGKIDAIPGKVNRMALRADEPGLYRGVCAEYCGIGHAHMTFEVRAHAPELYEMALAQAGLGQMQEKLPVLEQRREPAAGAFHNALDYLLRWVGLRR